jgi:hypothetical protein
MERVGFEWCNWNRWRLGYADLYVGQVGGPRAKQIKRNRGSTALLELDAVLGL